MAGTLGGTAAAAQARAAVLASGGVPTALTAAFASGNILTATQAASQAFAAANGLAAVKAASQAFAAGQTTAAAALARVRQGLMVGGLCREQGDYSCMHRWHSLALQRPTKSVLVPSPILQAAATAIATGVGGIATPQALAAALAVPGAFSGAFAQALAACFVSNPMPLCAMLAQARAAAVAQGGLAMEAVAAPWPAPLAMCH